MNIGEYNLPQMLLGKYLPMLTEITSNDCFSIVFRGEYQELHLCSCSVNNKLKVAAHSFVIARAHRTKTQVICTRSKENVSVLRFL